MRVDKQGRKRRPGPNWLDDLIDWFSHVAASGDDHREIRRK